METQKLSVWEKRKLNEERMRKKKAKQELMAAYPQIEKDVWGMPDFIWQSAVLISQDNYTELNAQLYFFANFDMWSEWKTKQGEIQWLLKEAEEAPDWIREKVVDTLKAL